MSETTDPIFARIAARYDLINRVLSLGREREWRGRGVAMLGPGTVLDLGCGTGATNFGERRVIGLDPVVEMLALSPVAAKVAAVGEAIPLGDGSVDSVFSAYVFRNLTSVSDTLAEIHRVLVPGGIAVVIDLTRPRGRLRKGLHRIGTAVVLPLVGFLFAGAPREYWYLHRSLDALPRPEVIFAEGPLSVEEVWRVGLWGFVYGARLRKPSPTRGTRGLGGRAGSGGHE
ncbi:MAG: class I SAM-dependent methyltransferase [Actinobacteria bacterium]|nr:class I SAM-dependent methyltransferase [Actinomycetota bacterium]